MNKQIRKLHLKLHVHIKYMLKVETGTVTKG